MGAKIYNSELTKEIVIGARLQSGTGGIPSELADKVIPTMEVNPRLLEICNIIKRGQAINALSATAYTTPTDKDFYLVGATISVIKDVTATSLYARLNVTVDGTIVSLMEIPGFTVTVQNQSLSISFAYPIKIDRNTTISAVNSTNVANVCTSVNIIGYVVDNINA
jgi:hypothetical protein